MESNTTVLFDVDEITDANIQKTLIEVYEALEERHYNPINQLVGYLMSGDPGYISSHKEARNKIMKIDRSKMIEVMLEHYIDEIK